MTQHSRFMHLRNDLAQRLWAVTDKVSPLGFTLFDKERKILDKIHAVLPTPGNVVESFTSLVSAIAFKVSKTCPTCDAWPCECDKVRRIPVEELAAWIESKPRTLWDLNEPAVCEEFFMPSWTQTIINLLRKRGGDVYVHVGEAGKTLPAVLDQSNLDLASDPQFPKRLQLHLSWKDLKDPKHVTFWVLWELPRE